MERVQQSAAPVVRSPWWRRALSAVLVTFVVTLQVVFLGSDAFAASADGHWLDGNDVSTRTDSTFSMDVGVTSFAASNWTSSSGSAVLFVTRTGGSTSSALNWQAEPVTVIGGATTCSSGNRTNVGTSGTSFTISWSGCTDGLEQLRFWVDASGPIGDQLYWVEGGSSGGGGGSGPDDYGDATDPDTATSCSAFDIVCRIRAALSWAFMPDSETLDQYSDLGGDIEGKIPFVYVVGSFDMVTDTLPPCDMPCTAMGSYGELFQTPEFETQYVDIPQIDVAPESSGFVVWMRDHRDVLTFVIWGLLLVPLAFWVWRRLMPVAGSGSQ